VKPTVLITALALAIPAAATASSETHTLAWHPSGKTPAAIQQPRAKRHCVEAANHHRGSKGPLTPVVRCSEATGMTNREGGAPRIASGQ
jgi:hypothetical protein